MGLLKWMGPFVPADEDVPHEGALPDLYGLENGAAPGRWQGRYTTADGMITLSFDENAYDWHIDAKDGYKTSEMAAVLEIAKSRDLELLDEDECEPELLADGTLRIYLAPIEDYPVVQVEVAPAEAGKSKRRVPLGFALAACLLSALVLPSPLYHELPSALVGESATVPGTPVAPIATPESLSPNKGALSGTESHRNTAKPSGTSEPLRPEGRVGTTPHRAAARGKAQGAHEDDDVHRLHRGQEQPDGLGKADGAGGSSPTPGPGTASPSPEPGGEGGQGVLGLLDGVLDGVLGSK
jgi:hypothetical protein